ncbi:MAG: hypothetical protein B7C24_08620 [Bacteroidetes bacterium 4572_77]|nr:MAG: hypothetical protein B7C24_08620 [Bacteroidetes bacterium 4572_77]
MKYLLLSVFVLGISLQSCKEKKKTPPPPPPPKKEVVVEAPVEEVVVEEEVVEAPQIKSVIVKQDEWLYDISRREYGNMQGWQKIYNANKEKIDNPDLIFPGQELVIPE